MRHLLLSAAVLAASLMTATPSDAMSSGSGVAGASRSSDITQISGGCGPAGFRALNGLCYRRAYAPPPPPPPGYGRRFCPPGFHPTPYGCRPNY